jgi:signal peptidase I
MRDTPDFFDAVQSWTEGQLSRRQRIRRVKKEKQRAKNPIVDWIEAFLWAVGMVLLINQYLVQAYQIPSGSMIDTLLIKDRIFVNKLVYGPELLPGVAKLPSPVKPTRNDVIILENPSYISRGPVFDIAQRIIYMLTFSLADIDRDESGDLKVHFLIKRAAGVAGDRFVSDRGELKIRFAGEDHWVDERDYLAQRGWGHTLSRLMDDASYPALLEAGRAAAFMDLGISLPDGLAEAASRANALPYPDYLAHERLRLETLRGAQPQENRYRTLLARHVMGWYVPEGRVFPLGDNRDNSRDGRYFGPVRASKILGKGALIYWPPKRMRTIR